MFLIGDPIRRHRGPQGATGGHRAAQAATGYQTFWLQNLIKYMGNHWNPWKTIEIYINQWKSIKIYENLWKPMKIKRKTMEINENLWKSMKSITYMGSICFDQRRWLILYSKHVNASHICPPKRNQLFKQRKWELRFSGKHWLWHATRMSKSHFL